MSDKSDPKSIAAKGPRFIDAKRRGFLQGAVVAGGAAASGASLAHHEGDHAAEPEVIAKPVSTGYRETDHVRDYYAAARS